MTFTNLLAALVLAFPAVAGAQTSTADHAAHHAASASAAAPTALTEGEVRKIDKAQGKVTLRHGPIVNLDMPAMTMIFKAADAKMLDTIKEGDKVRFAADKVNGVFTVTAIEPAN